ncbi:hypothetical protein BGI37_05110 [Snodgrassella alvi]|nr:hypothetical protein BGI37_05110 [Snodgrassella alvi]
MSFKNLYALLGVAPTASDTEIVKAMRQMAQLQLVELDDLKLCKATLLNPEERKKYNAQLFAECPEVLEERVNTNTNAKSRTPPIESKSTASDGLNELSAIKPLLALNSKAIPIYNEDKGELRLAFVGKSILPLLIGYLTPLLIGDIIGFLICLGIDFVLTFFLFSVGGKFLAVLMAFIFKIVLCLQYCNFYTLRKIRKGFKLCGTNTQNQLAAQCLKIKLTSNNSISNCPEIIIKKRSSMDMIFAAIIIWVFIILLLYRQAISMFAL